MNPRWCVGGIFWSFCHYFNNIIIIAHYQIQCRKKVSSIGWSSSSILTPKWNSLQGKMSNNINWSLQSQSIICNLFWSEIVHYLVYMLKLVHQILTRFIGKSMNGVKIFPHMKTKRTTFTISNFLPTLKSVNCEGILSIMPSWLMKEKAC